MVDCLRAQKAEKLYKVNPHVLGFQIKGAEDSERFASYYKTQGLNSKFNEGLLMDAKCPDLTQKGILHMF